MRKVFLVFLGVLFLLAGTPPSRAQTSARVDLYDLRTDAFPSLSIGLDPYDSTGNFVTGLSREAVTILEDNQPYPPDALQDLQPGVHFALAFDPGPYFAYRDAAGVSRYDLVYKILQQWASTHADSLGDDLSFIPTASSASTHMSATADFAAALEAYSPPLQTITPSLDTLAKALDAVLDDTGQAGMKPVVLYISSPQTSDSVPALQNLTQRAVEQHIRVNTWIVCSKDFFNTSGATALKDLAIQTGGQYVLFSRDEPLPGLETYLSPLRHSYRVTYTSRILASGTHNLAVLVNVNGESLTSLPFPFNLDVQPPNPILVAPPNQVVRQAPDEKTTDTSLFTPTSQVVEMLVEFPDGRTRPLISTTLYVDSVKVAENTAEPFDTFTWDLSGYATSAQHFLSVEVVDSYGLRRTSIAVPVNITVVLPERGFLAFLSRNRQYVSAGAIVLAGAALGIVLVTGRSRRRAAMKKLSGKSDPLTQPVIRQRKERRKMRGKPRVQKGSEAYLVRIKEDGQSLTAPPIPVVTPEMTFGSDPLQATRILDDPTVSPLHARLKEEKGSFVLCDERSAAGTWVNYEQITSPRLLEHGDVFQVGRVTYRFLLRKSPEKPAPKVTPTRL